MIAARLLRQIRPSRVAIIALAALCLTCVPPAGATEDVMAVVADGQPWTMQTEQGRQGMLTLFADGSATMRSGIMSMDLSWTPHDGGFCLTGRRMGTRCVALEAVDGGYAGVESGRETLRLSR